MELSLTPLSFLEEDERGNRFYIKREDLQPFCFGGNKLRIALGYIEDFRRSGAQRLITYGNNRSNLCRILANLCAAQGIPLTIIRPADEDGTQPVSFNGQISEEYDCEIIPCLKQNAAQAVDEAFSRCSLRGEIPYYTNGNRLGLGREAIPPAAISTLWTDIRRQAEEAGLHFDLIAIAAGTGMTLAGLAAGEMLWGDSYPLLGISIARDAASLEAHTRLYLNAWRESAGYATAEPPIGYRDEYRESYGTASPEVMQEAKRMMRCYGIPLDETYTAKGWWGLKVEARHLRRKNLLFIHTGGLPLYFDALRSKP